MNNDAEDISIPNLDMQGRLASCTTSENLDVGYNSILNDLMGQVEVTKLEVLEMENAVKTSFVDTEMQTAGFQTGALGLFSAYRDLIQDIVKETKEMRKEIGDLKMHHISSDGYKVDSLTSNADNCQVFANQRAACFSDLSTEPESVASGSKSLGLATGEITEKQMHLNSERGVIILNQTRCVQFITFSRVHEKANLQPSGKVLSEERIK
ncbi:hypothetical protein MTR_7g096600 [Medicago truncatula]|uniref:Uncharacterized protein n=1 Tax=Medicago truncatula TaxID=3880 RepID=A0A072UDL6_MEDTR|nr:hypothetical protein MTR_7g096600 [Medicago truncatula]